MILDWTVATQYPYIKNIKILQAFLSRHKYHIFQGNIFATKNSDVNPVLEWIWCVSVILSYIYLPPLKIYFTTPIKIDLKALVIMAEVYIVLILKYYFWWSLPDQADDKYI